MLGASQMGVTNGEKMNLQEEDPTNTIFERIDDNDNYDNDLSPFTFPCHNSVNFCARTSRFCMEVDLDNMQ